MGKYYLGSRTLQSSNAERAEQEEEGRITAEEEEGWRMARAEEQQAAGGMALALVPSRRWRMALLAPSHQHQHMIMRRMMPGNTIFQLVICHLQGATDHLDIEQNLAEKKACRL